MKKRFLFILLSLALGLLLACLIGEGLARYYLPRYRPEHEQMRAHLSGERSITSEQCVGQAYLLYVPAPGYSDGHTIHNEQGYRGKAGAVD